jgi:hypothetical protein
LSPRSNFHFRQRWDVCSSLSPKARSNYRGSIQCAYYKLRNQKLFAIGIGIGFASLFLSLS